MDDGGSVEWTAVAVAEARAVEVRQARPWFHDPLAADFVAAALDARPQLVDDSGALWQSWVTAFVQIRTRFFDEYLLAAVAAGCRQVVLLAAGLDTRAFRLSWPRGVRLYELDLPRVFAFKEPVLAARNAVPACERVTIGTDLRADWPAALAAAGHDAARPTAWLAEGLHPYLTDGAYERLLRDLGRLSAPGGRLGIDHHDQAGRAAMRQVLTGAASVDRLARIWRSHGERDPGSLLAAHGWRTRTYGPAERARGYGRPLPAQIEAAVAAAQPAHLVTADHTGQPARATG